MTTVKLTKVAKGLYKWFSPITNYTWRVYRAENVITPGFYWVAVREHDRYAFTAATRRDVVDALAEGR